MQPRQRQPELVAAVAAARSEHVAGETGGMDAHRNRLRQIGRADDDRDRIVAERVAEHHEARANAGVERHMGFAGDAERVGRIFAESRDRFSVDRNDARIE